MKDLFYKVLRDVSNSVREDLKNHPEKEKKLRQRLGKAYRLIVSFFGMREYQNVILAISEAEESAGDLRNYFDKALSFHYSANDREGEYFALASYIINKKMTPENALVLIFLANGVFFFFHAEGNLYRIYDNEIFNVLPYEFSDIKLVRKIRTSVMKNDIKRPLYDYARPSFYQAPVKRDLTPDEKDVRIMEELVDFDKKLEEVSRIEIQDESKYSFAKHFYLADQFLGIAIDSFSDEEITLAFAERKNDDIIAIIRSLDDDRKKRILSALPEIKRQILLKEIEGNEEPDETDYFAKEFFFKDAGKRISGHYLSQSAFFAEYAMVFDKLDKKMPTEDIVYLMTRANEHYAHNATWFKSDMVDNGRFF